MSQISVPEWMLARKPDPPRPLMAQPIVCWLGVELAKLGVAIISDELKNHFTVKVVWLELVKFPLTEIGM